MKVRQARADDLEWMLGELRAFSEFFGTRRRLFDDVEFARRGLAQLLESHVLFVAEHDTAGPVGFIGGFRVQHPLNPAIRLLTEAFWWVSPAHRGTRAGSMLLDAFTEAGRSTADWVTMALEEKSPVREEALTKRGFRLHERSYLLEVS